MIPFRQFLLNDPLYSSICTLILFQRDRYWSSREDETGWDEFPLWGSVDTRTSVGRVEGLARGRGGGGIGIGRESRRRSIGGLE